MVSLIISGVFLLFLIVGFLLGLKRGLKRTCIRGIWLAVVVVLLLILSTNITMKLLELPVGKWFQLTVDNNAYLTVPEYITALLEKELALDGVNYAETVNVVLGLVSMVINGVVFLICFWVLQLITTILYHICNIFIFMGERRKKKQLKKEGKKLNRHRLAGAFVGMGLGLVMFVCTITPLVGYLTVAKSVENRSLEYSETGIITQYAGDTYSQVVNGYDNSIAGKTLSSLELDKLMTTLLDMNSTVKINDTKLKLSEEAENAVDIYYAISDFNIPDMNTCTQKDMADCLNNVDKIIDIVFNSKIVVSCIDTVLPIGVKYARKEVNTNEMKNYVKNFVDACFDEVETYKSEKAENEIKNLVNLVRVLNKNNLLLPIVQNNTGNIVSFLKTNLTKKCSDEIVEAVFKLETATNMAPNVVNFVLGFGAEQVSYEYAPEGSVTATALKDASLTFLNSAVDVLSNIEVDSENNNHYTYDINRNMAVSLAGMLDAVKGLVSADNFNAVVNAIEPKLNDVVVDQVSSLGLPQYLKDNITKAINNISEISSFKESFELAYDTYEIVKTELDNSKVDGKHDVDKMDFVKIGRALDMVEKNELLKGDIVKDVILGSLDHYGEKYADKISETFEFTCIAKIRSNVDASMGNGLDINWEQEFPRYKSTVALAVKLADEPDLMTKLKQNDDTSLVTMGEQLDGTLKDSILFKDCDRLIVSDILQYAYEKIKVSNDEKTNNSVKKVLLETKNNVKDPTVIPIVWTEEFTHIKSIISVDFDNLGGENIAVIGSTLDSVLYDHTVDGVAIHKSKIITRPIINDFIVDYMDQVFKEVSTESEFDKSMTKIKTNIENRLSEISSYNTEFEYVSDLKTIADVFSDVKIGTINTAKPIKLSVDETQQNRTIGECFDVIAKSLLVGDAGYVVINDALNTYMEENTDYIKITDQINLNYKALEKQIKCASNVSPVTPEESLTVVYGGTTAMNNPNGLVDSLYELYKTLSDDTTKLTGDFSSITALSSGQAKLYDDTLARLQTQNLVVKENGALQIAIYAMNKLKNQIATAPNTAVKDYITNYCAYLALVEKGVVAQPYAGETETKAYSADNFATNYSLTDTTGTAIQINKPFEKVYQLVNSI